MLATVCKYLVGLFLLSSYKSLPGAYFVRFYYSPIKYALLPVFTGYDTKNIKTLQNDKFGVFRANKYTTYASPFECDFYFHKSNSTYFAELDVNRGGLMCKIFQKLFLTSKHYPFIPVANVFMNFLKEIKPFEKYDISSHIFCWDQKWLYIMSRFTRTNDKTLFSIAITKYVLKDGRKTINPRDAMKACGIYNEEVEKISQENLVLLTEKSGFHDTAVLESVEHNYGDI
ncbi:hypothetical protein KAFR_0G01660 [Kazachstania africana CBS 2517]|uniref:Thioesterase domain-containing protein n=1 Tax=Kazachstania africana (strain ATCC 22294 / BCRC 22015 / CBS 2517 / CECT 1963 / NBRC 1671 / NRRL Y-8276) TaxID=1071382 RepID=H2AXV0_KAZAF|nr:hypothetical protein KAFR_0G01660 [Kazachstania africana CBS 2517]CCF59200.1 hypothetical protein KAFR_0G01660 [Kazachstania africana CBS 2517]